MPKIADVLLTLGHDAEAIRIALIQIDHAVLRFGVLDMELLGYPFSGQLMSRRSHALNVWIEIDESDEASLARLFARNIEDRVCS